MLLTHELHFFASKQVVSFATEQGVTYLRNAHVNISSSKNESKSQHFNKKADNGLTEKRARSMACGLKLFSVLIFLVTFCIKTKSNSLRGN